MTDDDVRVPAGWYPDPLGLPQLRWWDNHAWTEHVSDARQPMVAQETVVAAVPSSTSIGGASIDYQDTPTRSFVSEPQDSFAEQRRASFTADPGGFGMDLDDYGTEAANSRPRSYDFDTAFDTGTTYDVSSDFDFDLTPDYGFETPRSVGARGYGEPARQEARRPEERNFDPFGFDYAEPEEPFADPMTGMRDPASALGFDDVPLSLEAPTREHASMGASPASRYARTSGSLLDAPTSAPYELDIRFDDLLGMPADPRAAGSHLGDQAASFVPEPIAEPIAYVDRDAPLRSATVPVWIMAFVPLGMLIIGLVFLLSGLAGSLSPAFLTVILGVPYAVGVILAAIDQRALLRAGFVNAPHWGWALLTIPAYLIVRLAAIVRETGKGYGPFMTWSALAVFVAAAVLAVPGLVIALAPLQFAREAEASVLYDASLRGADDITVRCPDTPPMLVQQQFQCEVRNSHNELIMITVSLQRANGWIDWRVDDWGINQM